MRAKKTPRKAAAKKPAASGNGMRTFALHAYDQNAAAMVSKLEDETAAAQSFGAAPMDPETAARSYLSKALASKSVPSFSAPSPESGSTDFKVINTETVPLTGTVVVKFRQRFNDIPVYGSLASVELDENNRFVSMNTSLGEPVGVSPIAKKSPADALKAAKDYPGSKKDLAGITPKLEYYFDSSSGAWHLAYILEDVPVTPDKAKPNPNIPTPRVMDYVVEAHTGKVLAELPRSS
jgi:Zn-dependent metalloprotease